MHLLDAEIVSVEVSNDSGKRWAKKAPKGMDSTSQENPEIMF